MSAWIETTCIHDDDVTGTCRTLMSAWIETVWIPIVLFRKLSHSHECVD